MVRLSGSVIPALSDALSMSFDCGFILAQSRKIAGQGVIVCARLSGWRVQQYRRRLLIASNRHTARRYFRCMGGMRRHARAVYELAHNLMWLDMA